MRREAAGMTINFFAPAFLTIWREPPRPQSCPSIFLRPVVRRPRDGLDKQIESLFFSLPSWVRLEPKSGTGHIFFRFF